MFLSQPQNDNYNYWIYHFMQLSFVYHSFILHLPLKRYVTTCYLLCYVCVVKNVQMIQTTSSHQMMLYAFPAEYHAADRNIHLNFVEK